MDDMNINMKRLQQLYGLAKTLSQENIACDYLVDPSANPTDGFVYLSSPELSFSGIDKEGFAMLVKASDEFKIRTIKETNHVFIILTVKNIYD